LKIAYKVNGVNGEVGEVGGVDGSGLISGCLKIAC